VADVSGSAVVIEADAVRVAVEQVRERIRAAGGGDDLAVLAVTKGFGPDAVEAAVAAGCPAIGENYAQEVLAKRAAVERTGARVHFIGQLQSNKVRQLAGLVDVYESVDRATLVTELARRAPGARVLVQVAPLDEPGKGGAAPGDVPELVDAARSAGLDVVGLMTVGPTHGGPNAARPGFRAVRALVDRLGLTVCSMGMTDDLEVAVEEGSTQVRIGTALFGPRARVSSSEQDR
jgi:pyridoxal phosphate enzyme (YggS family)